MPKNLFVSRVFWFNLVSLLLIAAQALEGAAWFDPMIQGAILAVGNAALRMLTGQPVELPKPGKKLALAFMAVCVSMQIAACAGAGKGGVSMTPEQRSQAISQAAGVLSALATIPLPPGVDPATAKQINAWRSLVGSLVPALEAAAQSPLSAQASPSAAQPGSSGGAK